MFYLIFPFLFSFYWIRKVGGAGETQESGSFQAHSPVSVLDSSGSSSVRKSLNIKSDIVIPVRTRSKRARPSNLNPWFVMPPISSARKMIRSRKTKEKKKRVSPVSLVKNADEPFQPSEEELLNVSADAAEKNGSQQRSVAMKKCTHCEVTKTPQWREGPMGPKTLCNACGVRYRSGRLFPEYRPAASPTFVPTIHSNSHKKVIEMRKKATVQEEMAVHDEVPVSPPPEFVPMSSSLFDFIYWWGG